MQYNFLLGSYESDGGYSGVTSRVCTLDKPCARTGIAFPRAGEWGTQESNPVPGCCPPWLLLLKQPQHGVYALCWFNCNTVRLLLLWGAWGMIWGMILVPVLSGHPWLVPLSSTPIYTTRWLASAKVYRTAGRYNYCPEIFRFDTKLLKNLWAVSIRALLIHARLQLYTSA